MHRLDSLHFAYRTWVASKFAVVGDECDSLNHRLGQQNTIKRILVCMRQLVRVDCVFAIDWEFGVAIIEQPSAQQSCIHAEILTSQALLNRDFPEARSAEQELVLWILDEPTRRFCQPFGIVGCPEQQMRIQQQFHSSPWNIRSISERPIVLKSSGIENGPGRNPSLRSCFPVGVSRAVTFTIGFPALAMMKGFPPAASSTKRDSCVLAL